MKNSMAFAMLFVFKKADHTAIVRLLNRVYTRVDIFFLQYPERAADPFGTIVGFLFWYFLQFAFLSFFGRLADDFEVFHGGKN
jgi:hypothetical protein